jgi:hypothetical protein
VVDVTAAGPVVAVRNASRRFASNCENHQENIAEGNLDRFSQVRQIPRASPFFLVLFLLLSLRSRFVGKISLQDRRCATMGRGVDSPAGLILMFRSSPLPQAGSRVS